MEFFPALGAGVAPGKFQCQSGFNNTDTFNGTNNWNNGTNMTFVVTVYNTSGTTANVYLTSQWKYTNHGRVNI